VNAIARRTRTLPALQFSCDAGRDECPRR